MRVLKTDTRVSKRARLNNASVSKMLEASLSIGRQRVGAFSKRSRVKKCL